MIIEIIGIIAIFIACIVGGYLTLKGIDNQRLVPTILGTIILLAAIVINISLLESDPIMQEIKQEKKLAKEMIENGADVYIDGQLIDPTKIVLEQYEITIINDYIILNN